MKKIVMTAAILLSTCAAFAGNENANVEREAYNMKVNYYRLGSALNLASDQTDKVEYIHDNFCNEMRRAAYAKADKRQAQMQKAVSKDLRYMRSVLNHDQYRTYVQLLNATLINRGLL